MPDVDQPEDDCLRASAAAEYLGVSSETVRNWARAGKIQRHLTLGGWASYPRSELERIRQQMHHPERP